MTKQAMKVMRAETGETDEVMKKLRKSVVNSILTGNSPLKAPKWFRAHETAMVMAREEQC